MTRSEAVRSALVDIPGNSTQNIYSLDRYRHYVEWSVKDYQPASSRTTKFLTDRERVKNNQSR